MNELLNTETALESDALVDAVEQRIHEKMDAQRDDETLLIQTSEDVGENPPEVL